jgi:hypothetical protein
MIVRRSARAPSGRLKTDPAMTARAMMPTAIAAIGSAIAVIAGRIGTTRPALAMTT